MICLYEKNASSFTDNGLCVLDPTSCIVHEIAGGSYELEMTYPMDDLGKHSMLTQERIIKAPVPKTVIPAITLPELKIWTITAQTDLLSKVPTTRYKNKNWALIRKVKNNPTNYAWKAMAFYSKGSIVLYNNVVYRAYNSSINSAPGTTVYFWQALGSLDDANPVIDAGTVLETLSANAMVYFIANSGDYIKIKTLSGKTGFVSKDDCEETVQTYQETIPAQTITEQLFRIYRTECDENSLSLSVYARHISYDMAANKLYECNISEAEPNEAIAAMQSALAESDTRQIACNITGKKITKNWSFKNPINALLDPEDGLVNHLKAKLVRNNNSIFILDASSPRTGIAIEYGTNMVGVNWTNSVENVITRVVPRSGNTEKGYMYIENGGRISGGAVQDQGKNYVESALAGSYAVPRIEIMNCTYTIGEEYEAPDGTKTKYTEADVRSKMLNDARDRFLVDQIDGAEITLNVEFVLLGDTEEYKQYRNLQTVCMYDVLTIRTGKSNINATAQVTEYEYDSILKRYKSIKVGTVNSFAKRVPGYKVVNESITYDKLSPDLINRILTTNASASSDSESAGSGTGGGSVTVVEPNTASADGIVTKGSGQASKVWKTDGSGNPAWRDEASVSVESKSTFSACWSDATVGTHTFNTVVYNASDAPVSSNTTWFVEQWKAAAGYGWQKAKNSSENNTFMRTNVNGTWSAWHTYTRVMGSTSSPVTSLDDLPLNAVGHAVLAAAISPSGQQRAHSYWKSGTNQATRYTVFAHDQYANRLYYNDMYDGTLKGWQAVPTGIANNLTSTSTTDALSANQGKVLKDLILNLGQYALSVPKSSSNTVSASNGDVFLVVSSNGNADSLRGAWIVFFTASSSTPKIVELYKGSVVSLTANSNGTVTFANSSTTYSAGFVLTSIKGSVSDLTIT